MKKIICLILMAALFINISLAEEQMDPMIESILTGEREGDSIIIPVDSDDLSWVYDADIGGDFTEEELHTKFDAKVQGDKVILISKEGKEGWIERTISSVDESKTKPTAKTTTKTYTKYKIIVNQVTRTTTDAPTVINYAGSGDVRTLDKNKQDYGQPLLTDDRWTDCNVVVVSTGWQGGSTKLSSSDPGFFGSNLANTVLNNCFNKVTGVLKNCKNIATSSHSNGGVMAAYTQTELDKMKKDGTIESDVKTTSAIISDGTVGRLKSLVDTLVNSGMKLILCASTDKQRSKPVTGLKDKLEKIGYENSTFIKTKNGHGDCHVSEEIKEVTKQEDLFPEYFNKNNNGTSKTTNTTVKTAVAKVTASVSGLAKKIADSVKGTTTTTASATKTSTTTNVWNTAKNKIASTYTALSNIINKIMKA